MAATINIKKCTSTDAGTETTVTTFGFKSVDDATGSPTEGSDVSNPPIDIPDSGTNYSYEVWLRLVVGATPPSTQITNIKWWGQSSVVISGVDLYQGTTPTGTTPVITESTIASGLQRTTWYSLATAQDISGTLVSTDDASDYIVLQARVADSVSDSNVGTSAAMVHYYSYQEN